MSHIPVLSNLQVELLKLYASDIPDADLLEIKRYLARFFMKKAVTEADKIWDERGYTNAQMENLLKGEAHAGSH